MKEEPHYYQTLILVADDCPAQSGTEPPLRAGKETVASLQYAMLRDAPGEMTQPDVLFESWLRRQDFAKKPTKAEVAKLRSEFFSKSQACLRASPLPKTYGWGLAFDAEGRVTLLACDSAEYRRLAKDKGVKQVKAMRSAKA